MIARPSLPLLLAALAACVATDEQPALGNRARLVELEAHGW